MERSSILMLSAMGLYLLSMVEVSPLAFVPGSHQGTGNIQLRGARAGASPSGVTGASEPLFGEGVFCLRAVAAMLSVSAASLSMRGSHSRSQSCVAVKAEKKGKAAAPKKAAKEPKKEAKKKQPEPPKKKEAPKKEEPLSVQEMIAGQVAYEEKIEGMVPLEKVNRDFRQMKYDTTQHWQIDFKALTALKDGPVKEEVTARYQAHILATFGKTKMAGAFTKKHPPSFFASMVMEAAKAQDEKVAVAKDLFELGKKLTNGLDTEIRKLYEGAAGETELVEALMKPIGSNNKVIKTLISFLIAKGRLAQLKDICLEFSILSYMDASIIPVVVQSHKELSAPQKKKIEDSLAAGLDTKSDCLKVEYEVDDEILAGFRVMFDFDDPINRTTARRKYNLDFRSVINRSLGQEFGV